ncbi:MAG: hypothetical protein ACNA8R_00445 [Nitriliruptoraceae bacterium]
MAVAGVVLAACSTADPAALDALEDRVLRLEAELDRLDAGEVPDRIAEHDADLAALRAELATTTEELTSLDDVLDDVTADVQLLLDAVTVLEEELTAVTDELRAELTSLAQDQQDTAAGLRSGLNTLDGRVDAAGSQLEELRTLIVTVRDRLDRCQADGTC